MEEEERARDRIKAVAFYPRDARASRHKAAGRIVFHAKCINWSYRNRGSVPRLQINEMEVNIKKKIRSK